MMTTLDAWTFVDLYRAAWWAVVASFVSGCLIGAGAMWAVQRP